MIVVEGVRLIADDLAGFVPFAGDDQQIARSEIGDNSKLADKLAQDLNVPEETGIQFANGYAYWGAQPFTEGPVYIGAVVCFLCIFALVMLKGWPKWWLLSTIVVGIVLAWGKNFATLNYFLFDHFPFYNKFRAPSTALFLPQLAAPIPLQSITQRMRSCIGIAAIPAHTTDANAAIKFAALAARQAKLQGGGISCLFRSDWADRVEYRYQLLVALPSTTLNSPL